MVDIQADKMQHCKKIQQVLWQDVRKNFTQVNSKLAKIIDDIAPGKRLPLIKVTYDFGDRILNNGKLLILEDFKNNLTLSKALKLPNIIDDLSYSPVPFGIFLNKSCEAFVEAQERIIPLFVLRAGFTLGLFETLDLICGNKSMPLWNVTAGARSTFMLAKINNNLLHKKLLRHFNISTPTPSDLRDHWRVFTAIANSPVANSDWSCEMLFFPKCWMKHLNSKSAGWSQLREYLFYQCWQQASPMIERSFSFIWQQFSLSTMRRNYKPRIHITDTIRHLMAVASNLVPAFAPSGNEDSLPINIIKAAYNDIYDLSHAPTIMEPTYLRKEIPFVYYSLGYPTLVEGHPETTNVYNTIITDLKEIRQLIENMHRYCQQSTGDTQKFAHMLQQVDFAYFHKTHDSQNEIYDAAKLIEVDPSFRETFPAFANKEFCTTAPFLNGCIQLKNKFLG